MNRLSAKRQSMASELSIGDLRKMIAAKRGTGGKSKVNPSISLDRVLDIYEGALAGRDDAEVPAATEPDVYRPGREKRTRDSLIIQNILMDCAQ